MKRLDELFEQILEIPISDIIMDLGFPLKRVGSNYVGLSPFRDDSSGTSFTTSTIKNTFKDWPLGLSGNGIKFVSLINELEYLESAFWLALKYSIISDKEYELLKKRYLKDNKNNEKMAKSLEMKYTRAKETKIKQKADIETLDSVYRLFISLSTLSDNHLMHLKETRELSDEEIKDFKFFTFPTRSIGRKFLKMVEDSFGSQDVLSNVPGFYRRAGDKHFTFITMKGIGIPIYTPDGKIEAIQIRKDEVKENEQRYMWFSSSFAENDPDGKVEFGTGSGAPLSTLIPDVIKNKCIFLTEGTFKAIKILKTYNSIACSIQGVSNWKGFVDKIDQIKELDSVKAKVKDKFVLDTVFIAYDADLLYNIGVLKQSIKLGEAATEKGLDVFYVLWDPEKGKGIDDALIAKAPIQKISNQIFKKTIDDYIEHIKREENISSNEDLLFIKKDKLKGYYPVFFELLSKNKQ